MKVILILIVAALLVGGAGGFAFTRPDTPTETTRTFAFELGVADHSIEQAQADQIRAETEANQEANEALANAQAADEIQRIEETAGDRTALETTQLDSQREQVLLDMERQANNHSRWQTFWSWSLWSFLIMLAVTAFCYALFVISRTSIAQATAAATTPIKYLPELKMIAIMPSAFELATGKRTQPIFLTKNLPAFLEIGKQLPEPLLAMYVRLEMFDKIAQNVGSENREQLQSGLYARARQLLEAKLDQ